MHKFLLSLLFSSILSISGFAQTFTQNFSSSAVVNDYINSSTPGTTLFTAISNTTNNPSSITGGKLTFTKNALTSAANGYISYGAATAGNKFNAEVIQLKFEFSVSSQAAASTSAIVLAVGSGSGFSASSTPPSSATGLNSRFAINFNATAGSFTVRNLSTTTTFSTVFSGPQVITFIINRQANQKTIGYIPPGGSSITETVPYGKWDLWVGTTKCFDDQDQDNVANALDNFKIFTQSSIPASVTTYDDFAVIKEGDVSLPVTFTSFTGKANGQNIDLNWKTASEQENSRFDIMRSNNGKPFVKIGFINGSGTTQTPQDYNYIDNQPFPGTNYYQLKQIDNNGTENLFKDILAIKSNVAASNFKIVSNKDKSTIDLSVFAAADGNSTFKIYDLSGRKLIDKPLNLTKGYNNFSLPLSTQGLHVATLVTTSETITNKFIQ